MLKTITAIFYTTTFFLMNELINEWGLPKNPKDAFRCADVFTTVSYHYKMTTAWLNGKTPLSHIKALIVTKSDFQESVKLM